VGCAFDPAIVHAEYFRDNPDSQNVLYNSKLGIYKEGCGLDNVMMSWGHDEYMYQVMKSNNTTLPPQALFIVRYHSFYCESFETQFYQSVKFFASFQVLIVLQL
jgi:inositol oxygenase